ncbi:T7SS effector LXG polymorphic toxin [Bacillus sp. FJAT-22090]|uniref:T7SS effector LXG polymorphic toxin n=1 Tax=Bacillus sp. FJAT-22090 TaxID=1581038 RepID=UPI0011A9E383|nr:T7SS effector LXG polymorphic toxin [Bacillus sp. FJAT-22090]
MKVLDVDLFQDGIQRNIALLGRIRSEIDTIYQTVLGLVDMEDQLKGAGGNAIRSFYRECHVPFLQFFLLFSENFQQVLQQMEAALHSFEPDLAGHILEQFLEGELEQGLTLISQLTASLTDETNSIMDQVSDIVSLPHLDDSGVQEGVIQSKRKRDDTVTGLHEFDATQTTALYSIEQDMQAMDTWLADLEGLFKAGTKDINFVQSQWDVLTLRSDIRTELFPKVYLNPSDLWVEKQEQLIGTMITTATFQNLEGKKVYTVEENVEENVKYHQYENGLLIKEYMVGETVFYEVVSKVEYKQEIVQADIPKGNKGLDIFQTVLDVAGLIPGVGEIADGVNGIIYSARGDTTNAALSFGAMIPFAGWVSTGGKFAKKGSDLYQARNVVSTEKMASIYTPIYRDVVNSPLGKTQNQLDILSNTRYQLGTPNALSFNMPPAKTEIPTTIKSGDVDVYGPYYDEAKKLYENNPDWYPNPDESTIVKGMELKETRADYQALVRRGELEKGHHKQGLAFGGENVNYNIKKTGESTIRREQLDDLNLDFYHEMGYGKKEAKVLKIHENEDGVFIFGNNPQHTEVTTFQNKVLKWQRENGKR